MGPLIPQGIISGDLNFFFAFIIGIAFGFLLEQAGFSSSRKLAGLFYGYDFSVLKVFLTAGFTAALGLYFFQYMGWMDAGLVYVTPLFTWSALVGGAIMGAGFVAAGFCPGTGFTAAAIGKIDALVFVGGMFAGVYLFGVFFEWFEPLYNGAALGRVLVHDALGLSQGIFLVMLIVVAIIAFYIAGTIERNSNRFPELRNYETSHLFLPSGLLFVLVLLVLLMPSQRTSYYGETGSKELTVKLLDNTNIEMDPLKVAHSLMRDIDDLHLVDVRSFEEYNRFHLPGAISVPLDMLLHPEITDLLHQDNRTTVFYSNGGILAHQAWFLAQRAGLGEFYVLQGGLNHFFDLFLGDYAQTDDAKELGSDNLRFIELARIWIREGHAPRNTATRSATPSIDTSTISDVAGGC